MLMRVFSGDNLKHGDAPDEIRAGFALFGEYIIVFHWQEERFTTFQLRRLARAWPDIID